MSQCAEQTPVGKAAAMQNWQSKKKSHIPLLVPLLILFIFLTILYNEIHAPQIQPIHNSDHQIPNDARTQFPVLESLPNDADDEKFENSDDHESQEQESAPPVVVSVPLDKSSTCNSTVQYSGRRVSLSSSFSSPARRSTDESVEQQQEEEGECDLFSGRWVFDTESRPLYNGSDCPYMSDQLACSKHGRPDLAYQHWRWQPHGCNLRRWNASEMWEKLRGKRLMFVGDSLNRGQWISLVCLMHSVIPADKRSITPQAHLTTFRAEEYNATIEFLWAPLLVESNSDDPVDHRLSERILRPDSNLRHSSEWMHADILVFNTYLWWRDGPFQLAWSGEKSGVCETTDGLQGMELAMENWADWMASNFDFIKNRAFFVTMSPIHQLKSEWNPGKEGNCYNEQRPIKAESYTGSGIHLPTMEVVNKVLRRRVPQVRILNITQLSDYRKDGHPSIYRKFWEALSPEKLANPASYSDCIHWCLPGVQDVWNELLFQFL